MIAGQKIGYYQNSCVEIYMNLTDYEYVIAAWALTRAAVYLMSIMDIATVWDFWSCTQTMSLSISGDKILAFIYAHWYSNEIVLRFGVPTVEQFIEFFDGRAPICRYFSDGILDMAGVTRNVGSLWLEQLNLRGIVYYSNYLEAYMDSVRNYRR